MPAQHKASRKNPKGKYAASSWGNKEYTCDLTVPSGQLCMVRRPGATGLIKAGLFDSLDSLSVLVQTEHIDRAQPTADGEKRKRALENVSTEGMKSLMQSPEKLAAAMDMVDRTVCYVVIQPHIEMPPDDPAERKTGVIYADVLDLDDKFFIFNFVLGGTEDLHAFREVSSEVVADLETVSGVQQDPG